MTHKITVAQQRIIRLLKEGGGSGVIDRYGRLLVAGEIIGTTPERILRLVAYGYIIGGGGRLSLNVPKQKDGA